MPDPTSPPPVNVVAIEKSAPKLGLTQAIIETPAGQPDVIQTSVGTILALCIRIIKTYLATFVTLMPTASATNLIGATDFLDAAYRVSLLSLGPAILAGLGALLTIFTELEKRFPLVGLLGV